MSPINQSRNKTAFTISIEAKKELQQEFQQKIEQKQLKLLQKKMLKKMKLYLQVMCFQ